MTRFQNMTLSKRENMYIIISYIARRTLNDCSRATADTIGSFFSVLHITLIFHFPFVPLSQISLGTTLLIPVTIAIPIRPHGISDRNILKHSRQINLTIQRGIRHG